MKRQELEQIAKEEIEKVLNERFGRIIQKFVNKPVKKLTKIRGLQRAKKNFFRNTKDPTDDINRANLEFRKY